MADWTEMAEIAAEEERRKAGLDPAPERETVRRPGSRFDSNSASVTQIESSKLLPMLIVLSVISGLALGLGVLAVVLSQISEREARLAQYDLQMMRARLEAKGINTDSH